MRIAFGTALLLILAGCQPGSDAGTGRASNTFLDQTPATPMSVLKGRGFEEVGTAYVADGGLICSQQIAFNKAGGLTLLKNASTGEKALCCLARGTQKARATQACKPVSSDYRLGPDVFNDRFLE